VVSKVMMTMLGRTGASAGTAASVIDSRRGATTAGFYDAAETSAASGGF
jgi:hypothetical protein